MLDLASHVTYVILLRSFFQGIVRLRMCEQMNNVGKVWRSPIFLINSSIGDLGTAYSCNISRHVFTVTVFSAHLIFSCGGLLRTRSTGHPYMIWQTYKKEFMLLSTMSHHRCFITHGLRLNTDSTFPVPLMEAMLRFMEHKEKNSQFSLFIAVGFIYRFVLFQKLQLFLFYTYKRKTRKPRSGEFTLFKKTMIITMSSFSNIFVTSSTSQLILQPFRRFTYVTAHSPTLPLLHLSHSSFSNPSFASPASQALHLRHLASRP